MPLQPLANHILAPRPRMNTCTWLADRRSPTISATSRPTRWRARRSIAASSWTSGAGERPHSRTRAYRGRHRGRGRDGVPDRAVGDTRRPLLADPSVANIYWAVPGEIGIVELDRLVVFQKHVNLAYVDDLTRRLPEDAPTSRCSISPYRRTADTTLRYRQVPSGRRVRLHIAVDRPSRARSADDRSARGGRCRFGRPAGRHTGARSRLGSNLLSASEPKADS